MFGGQVSLTDVFLFSSEQALENYKLRNLCGLCPT